jgi:hypothetical protein
MPTLSYDQVADLAIKAGFSPRLGTGHYQKLSEATIAVAIARAESGFRSEARNASSGATGLWQIHPGGRKYLDPVVNAKAARRKYATQGWNAWSVWKSGQAFQYFGDAEKAVSRISGVKPSLDPGYAVPLGWSPKDLLDWAGNAAGDVAGLITAPIDFLRLLAKGQTWMRVGMVLGGIVLLIMGLLLVYRQAQSGAVGKAARIMKG